MSLQSNTTELQSILDAVNALPEAGGGGGGASLETCTLTVRVSNSNISDVIMYISCTAVIDGEIVAVEREFLKSSTTIYTVPKNSLVEIHGYGVSPDYSTTSGGAKILYGVDYMTVSDGYGVLILNISNNGTVTTRNAESF